MGPMPCTSDAVVAHNVEQGWAELMALPRCVLWSQLRGGAGRAPAETMSANGRPAALWEQVRAGEPQATTMSADGALSDAMRARPLDLAGKTERQRVAIKSTSFGTYTDIVLKMQGEHKVAWGEIRWDQVRPISAAAAPALSSEAVRIAVRSFPMDSRGGPSVVRPQPCDPGF